MRKWLCLILSALIMASLWAAPAMAISYPDNQGTVLDTAGVLGAQTIKDIETLSERCESAYGGRVYVVTRHFLGGMDAASYAQGLFDNWKLTANDALLLMVIGEETYAAQYGLEARKALSGEEGAVLLGKHLRTAYLNRQYDAALAAFLPEMAEKIAKYRGASISISGLFGQEAIQSTPAPKQGSFNWSGFITSGDVNWTDYDDQNTADVNKEQTSQAEKSTGFSFKKLIIIALILYFLFGRKGTKNRYNFRHPPRGR